jgi:hypothetical protein
VSLAMHAAASFNADGQRAIAAAAIVAAAAMTRPVRRRSLWQRVSAVLTRPVW